MAHSKRIQYQDLQKDEEESSSVSKKAKVSPQRLLFLVSLISCSLLLVLGVFFTSSAAHFQYISELEIKSNRDSPRASPATSTICCDRTGYQSDICFMRGNVRIQNPSSVLLHSDDPSLVAQTEEKIRPYTRKWEAFVMDKIDELRLRITGPQGSPHPCDVQHDVPALFFSAGGYTGNVFHDFNDGLIPLYITAQHLNRRVILVVLRYHDWWYIKYREILSKLSDYPPVDFFNDTRTHCFPEAIVGLRFHGILAVDAAKMQDHKTIADFVYLLDEAYKPREQESLESSRPKLVILSRNGTRAIENEEELVKLGKQIGFNVEVLRPVDTTTMASMYRTLSTCDVMVGVHGAAVTHFLFMRPASVFIQIVPHGLDQVGWSCYGEPAVKMGLRYEEYKILPRESSLYRKYEERDPVMRDPESVKAMGWEVTKEIYLGQNVTIDLSRFQERLDRAFQYAVSKRMLQA